MMKTFFCDVGEDIQSGMYQIVNSPGCSPKLFQVCMIVEKRIKAKQHYRRA